MQPWCHRLFTIVRKPFNPIMWPHCSHVTSCNWMDKPPSLTLSQSSQYFILSFLPLFHEQTNKVLSPVFFLLINTIKYSENRSPALWSAITSIPNKPQTSPQDPRSIMHISGAVTRAGRKGRAPWSLAKIRHEIMTHTRQSKCNAATHGLYLPISDSNGVREGSGGSRGIHQ